MKVSTEKLFIAVLDKTLSLFSSKLNDYGCAWRVLRIESLTDQIFIKAKRIRTIQSTGVNQVGESQADEFVGILNYAIIAIIQHRKGTVNEPDMNKTQAIELYMKISKEIIDLFLKKNQDYGEAWKEMRLSSITDLIYQKVLRTKQIEDNLGKTEVSEGVEANYMDMVVYSFFCLVKEKYIQASI